MKRFPNIIAVLTLLVVSLLNGCTKSSDSEDETAKNPPKEELKSPEKSIALLPKNGDTCSEFDSIESEPDMASVFFSWTEAARSDNYVLEVFDSDTLTKSITVDETEAVVILDKGKLYTWTITSKNIAGAAKSDTFSFITPGEPIGNFVPYAAKITMDFDTANDRLRISWVGNDQDGDILTYNVKVEEEQETILVQSDLTVSSVEPIIILPGMDYRVEVISFDEYGNYSKAESNKTAPN